MIIACHFCPLLFECAASGAAANIRVKEGRGARLDVTPTIDAHQRRCKWMELIEATSVQEQVQRTQHPTLLNVQTKKNHDESWLLQKFWLPDLDSNQGPAD
jgi:hypothetical protein